MYNKKYKNTNFLDFGCVGPLRQFCVVRTHQSHTHSYYYQMMILKREHVTLVTGYGRWYRMMVVSLYPTTPEVLLVLPAALLGESDTPYKYQVDTAIKLTRVPQEEVLLLRQQANNKQKIQEVYNKQGFVRLYYLAWHKDESFGARLLCEARYFGSKGTRVAIY